MVTHNFTPQQGEAILNAVDDLLITDDHFYRYARYINDLFNDRIRNSVVRCIDGEEEVALSPGMINEWTTDNIMLSDFFYDIEEALRENELIEWGKSEALKEQNKKQSIKSN